MDSKRSGRYKAALFFMSEDIYLVDTSNLTAHSSFCDNFLLKIDKKYKLVGCLI